MGRVRCKLWLCANWQSPRRNLRPETSRPHAPQMSRGDGRKDSADRVLPQAAGMSSCGVGNHVGRGDSNRWPSRALGDLELFFASQCAQPAPSRSRLDPWALSRQISIGHFQCRIRPSASVIPEQKQWSSAPPRGACRQYRTYSGNAEGEVAAGEGSVRTLSLVHQVHVRLDPALVHQPPNHLGRAVTRIGDQARRGEIELFGHAVEHRLGRSDFRLANGRRRLDVVSAFTPPASRPCAGRRARAHERQPHLEYPRRQMN